MFRRPLRGSGQDQKIGDALGPRVRRVGLAKRLEGRAALEQADPLQMLSRRGNAVE